MFKLADKKNNYDFLLNFLLSWIYLMVNLLFCFEHLLHKFACTLYLEEFIMMVTFYLVSCFVKWCLFIFRF